ncbi:MAG: Fic family protein [Planctomycetota bacterium]|jgi:Fic family protein
MKEHELELLPPSGEMETFGILKKLAEAHRHLAELKGIVPSIPNESILLSTLSLQEAKDSSEIENIITTHDEMYKAELFSDLVQNSAAKEVSRYAKALQNGYALVKQSGLLTVNHICEIQKQLEDNSAGIRKLPGTELKSQKTGETVYIPPQDHQRILELMTNLEQFINDDSVCEIDPLIKMAIVHLQFESIHPFYDGNGRTGRIINILYLVAKGLLDIPVLYLSRFIIQNKDQYYHHLQQTRISGNWQPWIVYMLEGVAVTSQQTIRIIKGIKELMMQYKHRIRTELPKIYSQDLINNIFRHPYTKIDFLKDEIGVSRLTATKYLDKLSEAGLLEKFKIGRHNYYINQPLLKLFMNIPDLPEG